jgi:hypothetical protein
MEKREQRNEACEEKMKKPRLAALKRAKTREERERHAKLGD